MKQNSHLFVVLTRVTRSYYASTAELVEETTDDGEVQVVMHTPQLLWHLGPFAITTPTLHAARTAKLRDLLEGREPFDNQDADLALDTVVCDTRRLAVVRRVLLEGEPLAVIEE